MTREEYFRRYPDLGFELDPLDMNLARMQHNVLKRLKEIEADGRRMIFHVEEKWVAKNPEREYGEIVVEVYQDMESYYCVRMKVSDKQGRNKVGTPLYRGSWDGMYQFVDGKTKGYGDRFEFMSLCKMIANWFDYCVENDERQDLHDMYLIGEGMAMEGCSRGPLCMVNTETNERRQLIDETGHVVGFGEQDFDWEKLKQVEHRYCLDNRVVEYAGLGRYNNFRNELCCLSWMLYPEGRYFADEDGFGMEDNDEENIYCVIDKDLEVLIPFQPMTDSERQQLMAVAIEKRLRKVL